MNSIRLWNEDLIYCWGIMVEIIGRIAGIEGALHLPNRSFFKTMIGHHDKQFRRKQGQELDRSFTFTKQLSPITVDYRMRHGAFSCPIWVLLNLYGGISC